MKSILLLSALFITNSAFADSSSSARCGLGCEAAPQCEQMVKDAAAKLLATEAETFQLWGVGLVSENPMSPTYQLEFYGAPGTSAKPGHLITISHGYQDATNPAGACRIEMMDGKNLATSNLIRIP